MIVDMVMEYVHFPMDINMKENGSKEKNMDVELKSFQMDIVIMEYLNTTKLLDLLLNEFLAAMKYSHLRIVVDYRDEKMFEILID